MGKRSQLTIADILQRKMLAPPTAEDLKVEEEFEQHLARVIEKHGPVLQAACSEAPTTLHFKIILFPPSSNHCYFNHPRGGRAKTDKAVQFERQFVQAVHKYLPDIKTFFEDHDGNKSAYTVIYQAFFLHEEIINKTFGEDKKGSAVSRYKEVDAENRNKLISDSFAKALGITDKFFFSVRVDKMSAHLVGDVPQIHVYIQKTDPAFFGV